MSNVASRTYKKRGFCSFGAQFALPIAFDRHGVCLFDVACALGLNLHLQLPSKCTVGTFRCVWASRRAKPRLLTRKRSQKGSPRNRETAWPGELKDTVFRPALDDLQCQTLRPEPIKKEDFAALGLNSHFQLPSTGTACVCSMLLVLWGSICTSNCLRNAPLAPSAAFGRHDGQNHDF